MIKRGVSIRFCMVTVTTKHFNASNSCILCISCHTKIISSTAISLYVPAGLMLDTWRRENTN